MEAKPVRGVYHEPRSHSPLTINAHLLAKKVVWLGETKTWHGHPLTFVSLTLHREMNWPHPCVALPVKMTRHMLRTSTTVL